MLHFGNDDLIAGLYISLGKRKSDQVNTVGSAFCENNFFFSRCIDKLLHASARGLFCIGSLLTQEVYPTVYITVIAAVIGNQRIDHCLWLLRGGPIIKVYQRFSVYCFR
ncbi:hypothetical protein D3C80_1954860 [compost metagenome]